LDDFDGRPRAHIFAASKSGAHEIADALPRFAAYPAGVGLTVFDPPHEPLAHAAASAGASPDLTSTAPAAAGRCLCGEVGYVLDVLPARIVHCHCSLCRRSRGGPFSTSACVPAERFRFTRGGESVATFRMAPPRA